MPLYQYIILFAYIKIMAITYKLGGGIYKISPEASIFLANQMWLGKQQYGVTPGTIIIDANHMEFKNVT